MQEIIQGDCLEVMKTYPDNHFNCVVTDPPYGIKFMGKKWDYQIPNQHVWEELLRICKPGTMMLCFGGTRTFHRLACEIENAGWEIRDCLSWLYGSGFPKSHNNFGIEGYGTALKPAWEPILLCMQPLDGTFANNAEKWGNAGLNIDESRIETKENLGRNNCEKATCGTYGNGKSSQYGIPIEEQGRWPANLLLDETVAEMIDKQSGVKASRFFYCAKASSSERNKGCEELPLKQSNTNFGSGGFSRPTNQPEREIKPSGNHHPTIKPLKLMEYLIKLIAPPEPFLLDPFAGSGSTILAAKNLGISAIGIEINEEYCEIARHRLNSVEIKDEIEQLEFNL